MLLLMIVDLRWEVAPLADQLVIQTKALDACCATCGDYRVTVRTDRMVEECRQLQGWSPESLFGTGVPNARWRPTLRCAIYFSVTISRANPSLVKAC
jgi:hypothetical protein